MPNGIIVQDTVTGPMAAALGQGAAVVEVSGDAALAASGALTIGAGAVTKAKAKVFFSTEVTGTGSSQNVAHGLGVTPTAVLVAPTELAADLAAGYDCAEGTHTSTNVVLTITSGAKVKVLAWA
jgi:hypothetical protein